MHKKTKILATLGPATSSEEIITKLQEHGMSAVRLNFSHGTQEDHRKNIESIRSIEKKTNTPIAIVQDLQGPKIRLGNLSQDFLLLSKNQHIVLFHSHEQKDERIPVQMNIFPYLSENNHILINDGLIKLLVEKVGKDFANCIVINGGPISSHKGVNLPDTILPNVSLTSKDKNDLEFGLKEKVDYVAISFVQDEKDIQNLKTIIAKHPHHPKVIAKIETASAVKNLEAIIKESDAVMVARGDLAVELGQEEVPIIQRTIINLAKKYNKVVIVATQMLESMIKNAEPTRAEVNDVATAVLDEVDAVMLSGETAVGSYPVETVAMMSRIIKRVEKYYEQERKSYNLPSLENYSDQTTAIAAAACILAHQLQAKKILALTALGKTALRIASYRPFSPIDIITDNESIYRQLVLVWGITSYYFPKLETNNQAYSELLRILQKKEEIKKDDKIVLVTGTHPGTAGHTNIISVTRVGEKN